MELRFRLGVCLLLGLLLGTFAGGDANAGRPPPPSFAASFDNTVFPPLGLRVESEAAQLASWLGGALSFETNVTPVTETSERSFLDVFNRSFSSSVSTLRYDSGFGSSLGLNYALPAGEFVAFELAFSSPRPMNGSSLSDIAQSTALSLGVSALGWSYSEYAFEVGERNPNGTQKTHRTGIVSVKVGSKEVNFANQFRLLEDVDAHSLLGVVSFRWLGNLTSPPFASGEIVPAASEVVNNSYGEEGILSGYLIGIAPNYRNLTVSVLVTLFYTRADSGAEYVLFVDFESLYFQYLVSRRVAVVSGGAAGFVLLSPTAAGLVALSIFIIVGLAWFTGIDGHWSTALISLLVPLYARIKRGSVLDHFLRGRIVEFLAYNSTTTFSAIRERFDVANGVLFYHLWVLERTGFVGTVSQGGNRLYYVIGSKPREGMLLSEFQHALMKRIRDRGIMRVQDLARELETSKQRVHYNVKFLARQGLLQIGKKPRPISVQLTQAGSGLLETVADSGAGQSRRLTSSRADEPYSP